MPKDGNDQTNKPQYDLKTNNQHNLFAIYHKLFLENKPEQKITTDEFDFLCALWSQAYSLADLVTKSTYQLLLEKTIKLAQLARENKNKGD